ncbi:MAG: bifunctional diaminohydroxyphosphoribosylaminopyrimidine deaminase/5-amino-6-(5-phosphoribosylamino)uracil reductase RibD [Burkholderiales bacterium]|nr:bifunctional diaminohydroxyphosphoribosylaminopyrimidine deaminase/5-amino-6-(5-phosphoribosylamino)uracil reductase RibD [Burkholderiales bacterium]
MAVPTTFSAADREHMARALDLAGRGLYTTTPNPRVGCVIVRDATVVGEGWHARAGEPHAEVNALAQAGGRAAGATAYVTLEPCSHHGRTPPCTAALVAAKVRRVVAALQDPNPKVAGDGLAQLRAAGIEVGVGLLEEAARELNIGFVSRMKRGRPWVRLKVAASLDGRIALADGRSQWITGVEARRDGHAFRARACAVLTGIGTVRDDDPRLTVREVQTTRQPLRVVLDSRLELPPAARVLEGGNVLVAAAVDDPAKRAALAERGAEVLVLANDTGKVDLAALVRELACRGTNEVHVEAGVTLNGALFAAGLVDELVVYLAPSLLGDSARGMFHLPPLASLEQAPRLALREVSRVGEDVRLIARVRRGQR